MNETVVCGAAWLDEVCPGWAEKVDVFTLDMRDMENCVLGQVYGHMGVGMKALGKTKDFPWWVETGFMLPADFDNFPLLRQKYVALTEQWRGAVEGRKGENQSSSLQA